MARQNDDGGRAIGGEHELPLEHTARVRARTDDSGREVMQQGAQRAQKTRRRARDAQAERRAVGAVMALFVGFGALGFIALNLSGGGVEGGGGEGDKGGGASASSGRSSSGGAAASTGTGGSGEDKDGPILGSKNQAERVSKGPERQSTAKLAEVPDLPALRMLESEGLTAGAEGIPKVETPSKGGAVSRLAGLETCRFAYGVWEFSPNQTFRFISTCRGLGRLELVGAYEVREARIHLSELTAGRSRWTGVFEVEKPSMMTSKVIAGDAGRPAVELDVTQRITVVRGGLHGDDFRNSFKRKNRLTVPADASTAEPKSGPRPSALEELLGQ